LIAVGGIGDTAVAPPILLIPTVGGEDSVVGRLVHIHGHRVAAKEITSYDCGLLVIESGPFTGLPFRLKADGLGVKDEGPSDALIQNPGVSSGPRGGKRRSTAERANLRSPDDIIAAVSLDTRFDDLAIRPVQLYRPGETSDRMQIHVHFELRAALAIVDAQAEDAEVS